MEKKKLILGVDDLMVNNVLLKSQLRGTDYNVITAASGKEALKLIDERHPDLVLLDIMMPEMDGFQVLEKIRQNPETATLPVVMLTALSEPEHQKHAEELGCNGYLTKPLVTSELLAAIEKVLG